jgi:hypothetical protein
MWWREHAAVHKFLLRSPRLCCVLVGCVGSAFQAFPVLVTGTGLCVYKQSLGGCQCTQPAHCIGCCQTGPH